CQLLGSQVSDDQAHWAELAEHTPPGDVQLFYDIALSGLRDLDYAPDPLVGTSMTVLRMLAFVPAAAADNTGPAPTKAGHAAQPTRSTARPAPQPAPRQASEPPREPKPATPASAPEPEPAPPPRVSAGDSWPDLVQKLGVSGIAAQLARNGACRDLGHSGSSSNGGIDNDGNGHSF